MPRIKTSAPIPSKHKGQRSDIDPLFLTRFLPNWTKPNWVEASIWRRLVSSQQICGLCQEKMISSLLALDWKIEPRDSTMRDELQKDIKYYSRFIEDTGDYEYSEIIEWIGADYLTLPFGGAMELGRQGDDPEGKVLWIELLDGGTTFPTLNQDWPYGQHVNGAVNTVYFPKHAFNRIYMSPRQEINRKGWGVAPPERIYFALQLLSLGDSYYANLLLDTPESGILDLRDMSKESAEAWVKAWREMLAGIDPYKVPVLYEHTDEVKFIPFTRSPTDITYNESIGRYTALLCSGYGMSPSDIGLGLSQNGGNTLAGSIRDDRKFKQSGFARYKLKMTAFFNRILPETLRFKFIDIDDETAVSIGRARLAEATAAQAYVSGNMFTQEEMRNQAIADGLITISVPENLPTELKKIVDAKQKLAADPFGGQPKNPERPSMLGRPVTPSSGGWGETAARGDIFRSQTMSLLDDEQRIRRLLYMAYPSVSLDVQGAMTTLEDQDQIVTWISAYDEALWFGVGGNDLPELTSYVLTDVFSSLMKESEEMDGIGRPIWAPENGVLEDVIGVATSISEDVSHREQLRSFVTKTPSEFSSASEFVSRDDFQNQVREVFFAHKQRVWKAMSGMAIAVVRDLMIEDVNNDVEYVVYSDRALRMFQTMAEAELSQIANDFAECVSGIIISNIRSEHHAAEGLEETN